MPGKAACRQKKAAGHLSQHAQDKNSETITAALAGDPHKFFARVVANRGAYFQLAYHDGRDLNESTLLGSPCGSFGAKGKVRIRITTGDVVIVEGCERYLDAKSRGKQLIVEITGKPTKKESQSLYRGGHIHRSIYFKEDEDDALDFNRDDEDQLSSSEEDEEKERARTKKKRGAAVTKVKSGGADRTAAIAAKRDTAGSGRSGGGAGNSQVKEALAALSYANQSSAAALADDAEEEDIDLDAMADGLGAGDAAVRMVKKKQKQAEAESVSPTAKEPKKQVRFAAADAEMEEQLPGGAVGNWDDDEYTTPSILQRKVVPTSWEDDLDIDAI